MTDLGPVENVASGRHVGTLDKVDPSDSVKVLLLLRRTEDERDEPVDAGTNLRVARKAAQSASVIMRHRTIKERRN